MRLLQSDDLMTSYINARHEAEPFASRSSNRRARC